jgi:hypothetical protein
MSILSHAMWPRLRDYLIVEKDGSYDGDPEARVRIELRDLPTQLSQEAQFIQMACVDCLRPIYPLRRRQGDPWSRLYYAPTCALTARMRCARGPAARAEYDRFRALGRVLEAQARQLPLF